MHNITKSIKSHPAIIVFSNRDYRLLWPNGLLWQLARWMWMLVSGYLVLNLSESIIQTQLIGVAYFAPMLLGGLLSGVFVDSYDRRLLMIMSNAWNLVVVTIAIVLVMTGIVQSWQIIGLTFLFGVAGTLDITARRTLAFDLVGADIVATAISIEYLSATGALIFGPAIGGLLLGVSNIGVANTGGAYFSVLFLFLLAFVVILNIRKPENRTYPTSGTNIFRSLGDGLKAVYSNKPMLSLLGITVIINITFFPYLPLIPVFADQVLNIGPIAMGILGASQGIGGFMGASYIVSRKSLNRKYPYYIGGSFLALVGLLVFSLSNIYYISVIGLIVAGVGVSGFAIMQASLVLLLSTEETRGRSMGILSMAIGVLPISMLGLGFLAEFIGPGLALTLISTMGITLISIWFNFARSLRTI